jgi:hypothetical protein
VLVLPSLLAVPVLKDRAGGKLVAVGTRLQLLVFHAANLHLAFGPVEIPLAINVTQFTAAALAVAKRPARLAIRTTTTNINYGHFCPSK